MKQLTREEWLKWRECGITGSEAPIIMKKSKWTTPLDLFKRRIGLLPPVEMTYPMREGLRLEPIARARYEQLIGFEVPARCLTSEKWDVARASFDCLNEDMEHGAEIKCPGKEDHITALCGKIPDHYLFQLVHQMFVANLHTLDYVSYNPKSFPSQHQLTRVVLKRDFKLENALLAEEKIFWGYIVAKSHPDMRTTGAKFDFPVRKSRALIPPKGNSSFGNIHTFPRR